MDDAPAIESPQAAQHVVLRPTIFVRAFIGLLACCGVVLATVCLTLQPTDWTGWASGVIVGIASLAFGLAYATTEVHATPTRFWLRRYWVTVWSVSMDRAGTTEGRGSDWNLVRVFDLQTQKRVGAFNWWVLDPEERVRLAEFVDRAREARGVEF